MPERKAEQKIQRKQRAPAEEGTSAQTSAAASQFAAMALHDMHDPLEAIANLAYLVDLDAESPVEVRRQIRLIEEQRLIATDILRRTLGMYRSQNSVDLVTVIEAALRIHRHKITGKSLELRKDVPASTIVAADAGEILQVLSNLIANALDALPLGGVLSIRVRCCPNCVRVMVADNGHGIPGPIADKIFHPFFTTKGERGTGLGLAISKTLMARNRGTIRLRSSIRKGRSGTIFRLSLPTEVAHTA